MTYHFFVQANGFYWIEPYACAEDDDYRDLAMIARDGPIRAKPIAAPLPVESKTKPALASLTCIAAVDHRLGSAYR